MLDFKGIVNPDCPPTPAVTVCYGYDPQGNLTSVDNPAPLGDWGYTYDALSRIDTVTDGRNQVTNYDYDLLDRIDLITYQGGATIDYSYDGNGNVRTMTDQTGTTTYDYDKLNRLTQETLPGGRTNVYTYDASSNLTSFTDAGGTVTYVYNGVNNVTSVIEPGPSTITLDYHDDHLRKRVDYPGGVSQCFWYDDSDRIEETWTQRSQDCTRPNPNPPPRLTSYLYSYKRPGTQIDTGLIQTVTDLGGNVTTYSYDPLNRLTKAQTKDGQGQTTRTDQYAHDDNSNRCRQRVRTSSVDPPALTCASAIDAETTGYVVNDADQLTQVQRPSGTTLYTYDGNGNEDSVQDGRDFAYNVKDQASSVVPAPGQAAIPMTYRAGAQFWRETRGSTNFTDSALGLTREDSTSYTREPGGSLLGQRSGSKLYFLYDGLGSVVATTTDTGQVSAVASYDPFGNCPPTAPRVRTAGSGGSASTSTLRRSCTRPGRAITTRRSGALPRSTQSRAPASARTRMRARTRSTTRTPTASTSIAAARVCGGQEHCRRSDGSAGPRDRAQLEQLRPRPLLRF